MSARRGGKKEPSRHHSFHPALSEFTADAQTVYMVLGSQRTCFPSEPTQGGSLGVPQQVSLWREKEHASVPETALFLRFLPLSDIRELVVMYSYDSTFKYFPIFKF